MAISCAKLYREFRDWLLFKSGLGWKVSHKAWTPRIKEYIGSLAEEEGCQAIYTQRGSKKEFLLDVVWLVEKPRRLLELGMEIELSGISERYLRAFDKLLHVKANIKVGIFLLKTTEVNAIVETLEQKIIEVQNPLPKEEYLAIFLSYDERQKKIGISGYQIPATGGKTELKADDFPFPE
jgi:hypothetical protein